MLIDAHPLEYFWNLMASTKLGLNLYSLAAPKIQNPWSRVWAIGLNWAGLLTITQLIHIQFLNNLKSYVLRISKMEILSECNGRWNTSFELFLQ